MFFENLAHCYLTWVIVAWAIWKGVEWVREENRQAKFGDRDRKAK